jgi:hypothetical protein
MPKPSIFGSTENTGISPSRPFTARSKNAFSSSSLYVLSSDSIATWRVTFGNSEIGACPARCDGDHATTQSGCSASIATSCSWSLSYSTSLIVGFAST